MKEINFQTKKNSNMKNLLYLHDHIEEKIQQPEDQEEIIQQPEENFKKKREECSSQSSTIDSDSEDDYIFNDYKDFNDYNDYFINDKNQNQNFNTKKKFQTETNQQINTNFQNSTQNQNSNKIQNSEIKTLELLFNNLQKTIENLQKSIEIPKENKISKENNEEINNKILKEKKKKNIFIKNLPKNNDKQSINLQIKKLQTLNEDDKDLIISTLKEISNNLSLKEIFNIINNLNFSKFTKNYIFQKIKENKKYYKKKVKKIFNVEKSGKEDEEIELLNTQSQFYFDLINDKNSSKKVKKIEENYLLWFSKLRKIPNKKVFFLI
jgi:hypothetical protein